MSKKKTAVEIDAFSAQALKLGLLTRAQVAQAAQARTQVRKTGLKPPSFESVYVQQKLLSTVDAGRIKDALAAQPGAAPRIPGYTVLKSLGQGGIGRVFLATQESLGRTVALKVLHQEIAGDREFRGRFEREAKALARLEHPNVTRVFDSGIHEGTAYLAMEFVPGETVYEKLKKGHEFSESETIDILIQATQALDAAHRQGLVHRDIKPDNLMLTRGEKGRVLVKVCDFGLVKFTESTQDLTQSGITSGSPYYISPEQARGLKQVDVRSDLYSLGATAYRMIARRPPFSGQGAAEVMLQLVSEEPQPLSQAAPDRCSPAFSALVATLMAKNPAERHQSPGDLLADLEQVRDGEMPQGMALGGGKRGQASRAAAAVAAPTAAEEGAASARRKRRPALIATAGVCLLVGAGLGYLAAVWLTPPPPIPVVRPVEHPATQTPAVTAATPTEVTVEPRDPFALASAEAAFAPGPGVDAVIAEIVELETRALDALAGRGTQARQRVDIKAALRAHLRRFQESFRQACAEIEECLAGEHFAKAWQLWQAIPEITEDSALAREREALGERISQSAEAAWPRREAMVSSLVDGGRHEEAREAFAELSERFRVPALFSALEALSGRVQSTSERSQDEVARQEARQRLYQALQESRAELIDRWDFAAVSARCASKAQEEAQRADAPNEHYVRYLLSVSQALTALQTQVLEAYLRYLETKVTAVDDPALIQGIPMQIGGAVEMLSLYIRQVTLAELRFWGDRADLVIKGQGAGSVKQEYPVRAIPMEFMLRKLGLADDLYLRAVIALSQLSYAEAEERFEALARQGDERAEGYLVFLGSMRQLQAEEDAARLWGEIDLRFEGLKALLKRDHEPWAALRSDVRAYIAQFGGTRFAQDDGRKARIREVNVTVRGRILQAIRTRTAGSRQYVEVNASAGVVRFRGGGYSFRDPTTLADFTELPRPGSAPQDARDFYHEHGFMMLSGAQVAWWSLLDDGIKGAAAQSAGWVLRVGVVLVSADPAAQGYDTLVSIGDPNRSGTGLALQVGVGAPGGVRLAAIKDGAVVTRVVDDQEKPLVLAEKKVSWPRDRLISFEIDCGNDRLEVRLDLGDGSMKRLLQSLPDAKDLERWTTGHIALWCPRGLRAYYRTFFLDSAKVR